MSMRRKRSLGVRFLRPKQFLKEAVESDTGPRTKNVYMIICSRERVELVTQLPSGANFYSWPKAVLIKCDPERHLSPDTANVYKIAHNWQMSHELTSSWEGIFLFECNFSGSAFLTSLLLANRHPLMAEISYAFVFLSDILCACHGSQHCFLNLRKRILAEMMTEGLGIACFLNIVGVGLLLS